MCNEYLARGPSAVGHECWTTGAQNLPESEPNLEQVKVRFPKLNQSKTTKVAVMLYGKSKGGERKQNGRQ